MYFIIGYLCNAKNHVHYLSALTGSWQLCWFKCHHQVKKFILWPPAASEHKLRPSSYRLVSVENGDWQLRAREPYTHSSQQGSGDEGGKFSAQAASFCPALDPGDWWAKFHYRMWQNHTPIHGAHYAIVTSQGRLFQDQRRHWATVHQSAQLFQIYIWGQQRIQAWILLNWVVNSGNRKSSWDPHLEVSHCCLYYLSQDILFF